MTENYPGCQLSQKGCEGNGRMEAMDSRKCNKSRETIGRIPQKATERKNGFLEGCWFLKNIILGQKEKNTLCEEKVVGTGRG